MTFVLPTASNGYIDAGIVVDPTLIIQQAFKDIKAQILGWQPHEGQLDVAIIEEMAQMMGVMATVASQVLVTIFQSYGKLVGIELITGSQATVAATFTMTDTAGYTIPTGFPVQFALSGNQFVIFTVQLEVVIPTGSTTGTATLVCESVGSFANGILAGPLQPVTQFPQIDTIESTATTSGGADPETSTAYINRLSNELQLLTPRPILIGDFAALSANVPGVFRALAIDNLNPGRSVTDGVLTNASLNFSSATLNLSALDEGRTIVDSLGKIPAGATIATVTGTTTGTLSASHAATASETGDHFTLGDLTGQERCVTVCGIDDLGDALSGGTDTALAAYLDAQREVNFLVFTIDPTYTEIDVTVSCDAIHGQNPSTVQAAILANLTAFLNKAVWGGGDSQVPAWNATADTVRFFDIANVVRSTQGVLYIPDSGLSIALHGNSLAEDDLVLPGLAPLPTVGTLTVSVAST